MYVVAIWLSQWGSKSLADQGYTATEILRYYYGDNIYINSAEEISGIPSSWPGYDLDIGATGPKVEQMQEQLNAISNISLHRSLLSSQPHRPAVSLTTLSQSCV